MLPRFRKPSVAEPRGLMKLFRNLLIRRKLMLIMTLSSAVTLLVGCVTWLTFDWTAQRRALVGELVLITDVIGTGSARWVAERDINQVRAELEILGRHPGIRRAVVFDTEQRPLAMYWAAALEEELPPITYMTAGHVFGSGGLVVYRPLLLEGNEVGSIAIESDLRGIRAHLLKFSGILIPLLAISLLASSLLSFRLKEVISGPVLHLTDTVRSIAEDKDYTQRATKVGTDEIGFLTDSFNEMLETLQYRENELQEHRDLLEDQVQQRTKQLVWKNEQLQLSMEEAKAAAVAKSQFLANMSHEIRTPMNGILGMNELLLGTPMSEQQRSYAEIVKSSAESLLELINEILDFSKIEAGKLRLEEIDFEPYRTIEEVIGLLSGPAHKKGLELVCWIAPNIPSMLRGDPTRVRQIITNLIGNAVKFTEHGRISVRVEKLDEDEDDVQLRIFVQDTGIGISTRQKRRLFQSFSQVDPSTTRKYGGTGLGLAISRQLVELMGGEIGVESEVGVGSTFWFTARFQKVGDDTIRSFILPDGLERPRILVADSSAAVREVLHQQFKAWGVEHEIAGDVARVHSAVRTAIERKDAFGLILLDDLILREASEELESLLSSSQTEFDTRVVLMSWKGSVDEDEAEEAACFSVNGRLLKPIRPSQLFDTVLSYATEMEDDDGELEAVTAVDGEQQPAAAELRILLAEDNEINQLVASKILSKGGYECRVVRDGFQAFDAVRTGGYHVVLMDCQMPEMDGFEATRRIRAWEKETDRKARVHIIALTANAMKGDKESCLLAGMDDYLSKPVKPEVLLQKLREFQRVNRGRLEAKRVEPSSHGAPFDVDDLLQRYEGRRDALRQAIANLDRETIDSLGRIKSCLGAEYSEDLEELVQDLREAIALISSQRLQYLAVELERLAGERRFDQALECFDELQREFSRCRAHLPEVLAQIRFG